MNSDAPAGPVQNPDIEFFQQMADGAPVMIWMSGSDMGCFYFNRTWLDFTGRTMQQEFGNGWAEGVHPEDLERCVQHYVSSFEKRASFAMSYRLRHHSGEYRWILDRGVPHYDSGGGFLGFYGGCAETPADVTVGRVTELRQILTEMRALAGRVSATQAQALRQSSGDTETLLTKSRRLALEHRARQHAVAQMEKLAADMLAYDQIARGVCLP
jgi:PAS domain S-box-containing protein